MGSYKRVPAGSQGLQERGDRVKENITYMKKHCFKNCLVTKKSVKSG